MEWYYASNGQTNGPVGLEMIRDLYRTGAITLKTHVWRSDLKDWTTLSQFSDLLTGDVQTESTPSVPLPAVVQVPMVVCAHSGDTLPQSEMLEFGDKWISPKHKDAFLQGLGEGSIQDDAEFDGDNRDTNLKVGTIMTQSWGIWRKNIVTILLCQAVVWIPGALSVSFICYEMMDSPNFLTSTKVENFFELLIGVIAAGATYGIASHAWDGYKLGFTEAMRDGFRNYWRFLGTSILRNILTGIATILLIIPGLFLMLKWVVALPVAYDDEQGGSDILRESWDLTAGYFWKVLGIQIVGLLICCIGFGVVLVPIFILAYFAYEVPDVWYTDAAYGLVVQFLISFMMVETYVLFRHLRAIQDPRLRL